MSRPLVAALAGTLAVAALAAAGPPPAAAARPALELGLQDDPVFVRHPSAYSGRGADGVISAGRALGLARRLGARTLRINLKWWHVAPAEPGGPYDWSAYDGAVNRAAARGLRVQFTLTGPAPAWATGDGAPGIFAPDPALFGHFAAAAARHFAGRVRRYSIWNEPNWPTSLGPRSRAAAVYRRLYEAGYAAVKGADPRARVLFGELAPMGRPEAAIPPLRFLRAVMCVSRSLRPVRRCAGLHADGFAHHPYTLRWPPEYPGADRDDVTTGSLGRLTHVLDVLARRRLLATPRGRPLDLFLTEYGWHARSRRVPAESRIGYLVRGLALARESRRVRQVVWYQLAAPPPGADPNT